ncbi:MAG: transcriptional repressor, LexA family, partial [Frankiales bacterium]|nr:transcriptional repressor, LexA family [Frankiales bacterium]
VAGDLEAEQGALTHQFPRQREDLFDGLLGQYRPTGGDPADDGHVWLLPHNPAYDPIPGDEATIQGRVVSVLRRV